MATSEEIKIVDFIQKSLSNEITDQEFRELNNLLQDNKGACRFYREVLQIYLKLEQYGNLLSTSQETVDEVLDERIWVALAEYEKSAPVIEIPDEKPEIIQETEYVKPVQPINKSSLVTGIISISAILFVVVFLKLTSPKTLQQIAVLSSSMSAEWVYPRMNFKVGDPIYDEFMELSEGFAEFTLENGAKLVVEGPARFEFEDAMQVFLKKGKLVAKVTPEAKGFMVRTDTATIVDYGTEFGVISDPDKTEAHVFSGKVDFRTGPDVRRYENSMRLEAGQAAVTNDNDIQKIEVRSKDFYKNVPTQYELYIHQLKPSFYSHAAEPDQVVNTYTPDVQSIIDDSVRCVRRLSLDRQPHEYAWEINGSQGGIQFSEFKTPEESFTAIFWTKPDVVQGFQTIFAGRYMLVNGGIFYRHIALDDSGRLIQYYINDKGEDKILKSIPIVIQSETVIETGQWYHVALIYDGLRKKKTLMINGVVSKINISSKEAKQLNCTGIYLGGSFPGQLRMFEKDAPFSGKVSDVLYFNRAIRAENIKQLYEVSSRTRFH